MTALAKYLDSQNAHKPLYGSFEPIRKLLPAHDAEIAEQAKLEQMEADCKAQCLLCRDSETAYEAIPEWSIVYLCFLHMRKDDADPETFPNDYEDCGAEPIRAAWAKAHLEEAKGNAGEFARS